MTQKPSITSFQLLLMAAGSALVFPYTFMPILNAPPSNQDVWIVLILTILYSIVLDFPLLFIVNKFRGNSANEIFEKTLGKFLGKLFVFLFLLFFLFCFCACMLIMAIFINLYLFPDTPTWGLLVTMLIAVSYSAYKGAGTIGRLATIFVPIIIFTIIIFFLMGIDKMDIGILKPVLVDSKFIDLNMGAFLTAARYSEIFIFLNFSCFLKREVSVYKTYLKSMLIFGAGFLLILLPTILVLGVDFARIAWNPYYVYTRQVEAFGFLERMHAINTLAWFPLSLLKLTMYNFMACRGLSGIFGLKSYKPFVIPVSAIGFIVSLLPIMNKSSTVELLRSDTVFPFITLPVIFVIPLITMVVYLIRKKKINTGPGQNK